MILTYKYLDVWKIPAMLFIVFITVVILLITGRLKEYLKKNKFNGYVCEQCGADYAKCNHAKLEDYTLVKKA
jgi:hypothetical protein